MTESYNLGEFTSSLKGMVRGEDLTDLKEKCLDLCQQYLGGIWTKVSVKDIEVNRLTGGASNQVYHCTIKGPHSIKDDVPQEVVIRFYGQKYDLKTFDADSPRFGDAIIGLLASQNGVGPKLYGLFPSGQIQKYYPNRLFEINDLYNNDLRSQLASKLAQFHAMRPPVAKNRYWLQNFLKDMTEKFDQNISKKSELFVKYNCKTLLECDLKAETEWVLSKIESFESPIVLSHNDFRISNILISEGQVILNDLEHSDFYYRGIDFISLFNIFDKPEEESFVFRDETIVKVFIEGYIAESENILGKQYSADKTNSVQHILEEIKRFLLVNPFMTVYVFIMSEELNLPNDEKCYLGLANSLMKKHLVTKKRMIERNLV